ncbi:MAG: hypothetical protein HZA54_00450, partial [Planctomycetes bacterium]|nr:hypothetical protein [Planctomycetota bacterium]
ELDEQVAAVGGPGGAAGTAAAPPSPASPTARAAWNAWAPVWSGRLEALATRLRGYPEDARVRFFFPAASRVFGRAPDCLRRAFAEGALAAAGNPSAKFVERAAYFRRARLEIERRVAAEAGAGERGGKKGGRDGGEGGGK